MTHAETVIIGAGLAGLVTAYELMSHGQAVTIIEKRAELGGLAKESFGGINITGSAEQRLAGIHDSPALAYQDWCSFAEFSSDEKLGQKWAQFYTHASKPLIYRWLKARGLKFFPVVHWVERGKIPLGNRVPRFHMIWGTGLELIKKILHSLNSHPQSHLVTWILETEVTEIGRDSTYSLTLHGKNGRISTLTSNNVVVASGGYASNLELVKQNWDQELGIAPTKLLNGAHSTTNGNLHHQLEKLGVKLTNLQRQWLYAGGVHHPRPRERDHGLSLVPPHSALWVDATGKRIGPTPLITSFDTRWLVKEVLKTGYGYSWQILNLKIALKELAVSGAEYNDAIANKSLFGFLKSVLFGNNYLVHDLIENCQDFVVGDNLEDLVDKMERLTGNRLLSHANLQEAIESYDHAIKTKDFAGDSQLRDIKDLRNYRGDRARTAKFQTILDKKAGPLLAIREFILTRKCLGGAATLTSSECVDLDNKPIKGLYAVGETAGFGGGGIHGKRSLEGTFLGSAILTGMSAAHHMLTGKVLSETYLGDSSL